MLAGSYLVVRVLYRDAHLLQRVDRLPPVVLGGVERGEVEIPAAVQQDGIRPGVGEVEVLDLRRHIEGESQIRGTSQVALQDCAWISEERVAVGRDDVAEHPGHLLLLSPRQDLERGRVGHGQHVGLLDAGVAVDRRAIESHSLLECSFEFLRADRHRLQEPLDVGEPEPDETDPAFLDRAEDVLGLSAHDRG